jgi:hypothetical protein
VEPADRFTQAERAKLLKPAGDGGDAAEALTLPHFDRRTVGERRHRNERLAAFVDAHPHLAMPTQRLPHLAQCFLVALRNRDVPKHVHLADLTIDRIV